MPRTHRQQIGRYAAAVSWSRTADRSARTRPARENAPGGIDYHLERLDPDRFADATEGQKLAAAEAARRAYFQRLALASAKARSRRTVEVDDALEIARRAVA